jgi:hypothetical protein
MEVDRTYSPAKKEYSPGKAIPPPGKYEKYLAASIG